jgi:hypothetical protein
VWQHTHSGPHFVAPQQILCVQTQRSKLSSFGGRNDEPSLPEIIRAGAPVLRAHRVGARAHACSAQAKPGDKVPDVVIDFGFNPIEKINLAERCAKGKRILLGLPGAFTPC